MNEREIFGEGGGLPGSICDGPFGMVKKSALVPTNDPESYNFQKGDTVYRNYVADELKGKVLEVVRGKHDSQMVYVDWGDGEVTVELSSWLRKDPTMVEHHDLWPTTATVIEKAFNPPQTVYENSYGLTILSTRRGWVVLADKTYPPASNIQDLNEVLAGLSIDFYPEQLILKAGEDGKLFSEEEKLKQEFASGFFDEKAEEDLEKVGAELASLASSMGYSPKDYMSFLLKEMNFQEHEFIGENRGTKLLEAMKKTSDLDDEPEGETFDPDKVEVGDIIEYDLDRVKQYSNRARRVNSWEGRVKKVHSNGYTVVADGVEFFVNYHDVIKDTGKKVIEKGESREGSKKVASIKVQSSEVKDLIHAGLEAIKIHGSLSSADKEIYNLVKDTFGEAVANENTGVMADILRSQGLTASFVNRSFKGHNCDNCGHYLEDEDYNGPRSWSYTCPSCGFKYNHWSSNSAEQQVKKFRGRDEDEIVATKRTALQDGIPPNSSPGWNESKGDFDTFKRRGLDDKPTTEEDAKRQVDPEVNNPFDGLNIPDVPSIEEDTLSKMESGDRREIDNLLAATRDISSKIMDSVKGLNENDQIPDTLKEDVNKLNDIVKRIDQMTTKYKTKKEEVKTQVDLFK